MAAKLIPVRPGGYVVVYHQRDDPYARRCRIVRVIPPEHPSNPPTVALEHRGHTFYRAADALQVFMPRQHARQLAR